VSLDWNNSSSVCVDHTERSCTPIHCSLGRDMEDGTYKMLLPALGHVNFTVDPVTHL